METKLWKPRHVKNVWPEREKFLEMDRQRRTKGAKVAVPHVFKSSPGLTVTDIVLGDETASTDHVGTSITQTLICKYVGDWDALYITANAASLGLPWYGDYAIGANGYVYCSHTSVKWKGGNATTNSPGAFDYTATFSPITPDRLDLPPLSRPPVWEYGGSDLTEVRRVDQDGTAITNSAGDYFEGLPEFYVGGTEASVTWNVSSPYEFTELSYTTNEDGFGGWGAEQGFIGKVVAEETFETFQGVLVQFWRVTIPFRFRNDENGWRFCPFDYGYRFLNDDGKPVNYVDPSTGVYGPVFLDGSGGLLGDDGTANNADPVVYPSNGGGGGDGYKVIKTASWGGLPTP